MRELKNKKIQCVIFLIYFSIINISNAQNDEITNLSEYNNNSYLTINLLSSINPIAPRWRIGYIRNINERWKVGIDVGYGNANLIYWDLGDNYELWEIRPEFYYFLKTKRKTKKYLSFEPFYTNHKDIFIDSFYNPENAKSTSYDQANYKRQKYGVNFKYGFLFNSRKRLGFNLYSGLGLRIRNNTFSNIINPTIVDLGPEGGDFFGTDAYKNLEGTNFGLNFVLGIKLYYRLNN
jgi:hypothetical protein